MRGIIRSFCAAAGLAACLVGAATAMTTATQTRPAKIPLTLAGSPAPRIASSYLDGTSFSSSVVTPSFSMGASGTLLRAPIAASFGPPGPRDDLRDFAASLSVTPELALDLGYRLDDAGRFVRYDFAASVFDGLFLSPTALGGNVAPFGQRADYLGATWRLADNVRANLGEANFSADRNPDSFDTFADFGRPVDALLNYGARKATSLMAGVTWDFSRWGAFDIGASQMSAHDGLLADTFDATSVNVSARVKFGGGWVTTASVGQALTKLDLKPSAATGETTTELSRTGYALAVAKHGVFGDDAIGLSVSQPATPSSGFDTVANGQPSPVFIGRDHLLDGLKPETDIEVGYVTTFLDGSLALQTNAAYQMNFAGQSGTNALSLLSRAKIKF